ncbi:hypothetical protein IQ266_16905 [filamentous cyanobacterium LEGE 11480]|uniref:Uncharacterized protein n=1 Tax=Romeriopsis navalis LEGE 11480 TaxID=2777977 RepID=A0A928VMS3_9CYAN|nr:hypothetical protein [Romeriopsis navalis]MBE9031416.1 hypothetical protein [Romeriopsis navalis LEGE 11480]
MERGLLWLPLLGLFFGLAWAGWNEYTKLEAYKVWATSFDRAKYDIRAVLGQSGMEMTWGVPDRSAPKDIQTFSLRDVEKIQLVVDGVVSDWQNPPTQGKKIALKFLRKAAQEPVNVPFTQIDLAARWATALQKDLKTLALT